MDSCSQPCSSSSSDPASILSLKHRFLESRQQSRALKQLMREQKERSRKLIVAVAFKLQEKEGEIEKVRKCLQFAQDVSKCTRFDSLPYLLRNRRPNRVEVFIYF